MRFPALVFAAILLGQTSGSEAYNIMIHQASPVTSSSSSARMVRNQSKSRRSWLGSVAGLLLTTTTATTTTFTLLPTKKKAASAAEFTPGGTLVDRPVGVVVGNSEASTSRKPDNSNVLFDKDYYFKFGTAPQYILPPGSTDFPKTMPFTKSQQRYDALKKYRERVQLGLDRIKSIEKTLILASSASDEDSIADPTTSADVYQLRPMGLLANGMLASENTGATNELFLARWYVNEAYLLIADLRRTDNSDDKKKQQLYKALKHSVNSYLTMLNRVITPKVGDPFEYI